MPDDGIYYVGARYKHHAKHSGYERFGEYVGSYLKPPVNFRWVLGKYGWSLSVLIAKAARHPLYSLGAHLTEWSTLRNMLAHKNCIYHILYGDSDLWLLRRANRLTRNHLVATFHEPPENLRAFGNIERISRHLDGVICVSASQRIFFEAYLPSERIFVVHHGVDTDFFQPGGPKSGPPLCVTVGSHLRDYETLGKAIQLVWEANPEVRFAAVGTRTENKTKFPDLNDGRIQFYDWISDEELLRIYQSATLAVSTFQNATATNSNLEAMASGLPVVATDVGGVREYVRKGAGLLCPPQDPRAVAAAILRLIADAGLQRSMSLASRDCALEHDYQVVAAEMKAVYEKIWALGPRRIREGQGVPLARSKALGQQNFEKIGRERQ